METGDPVRVQHTRQRDPGLRFERARAPRRFDVEFGAVAHRGQEGGDVLRDHLRQGRPGQGAFGVGVFTGEDVVGDRVRERGGVDLVDRRSNGGRRRGRHTSTISTICAAAQSRTRISERRPVATESGRTHHWCMGTICVPVSA
ncbi:MAG: hypothetical protein QM809_12575 [Gordonia sp. (in: high G+C Gram-positive bacteria)]|uniref:hypothetical protein n=1 Tax=Gordonia sp. (in: high G+C Gram-positive bacteria) TaxID=84139 RepID=UPI0039E39B85